VGAITFPDSTNIVDIVDSTDNFLRGHGYRTTVPPIPADSITATSTPIAADHTISSGLSDAAKIGIGVGTGFAVLMLLGALSAIWIILRRNHTNNGSSPDEAQTSLPMHNNKEMGPVEMPAMPALPPKSPFTPRPQFIDQRPQDPSGPWLMSCHAQPREKHTTLQKPVLSALGTHGANRPCGIACLMGLEGPCSVSFPFLYDFHFRRVMHGTWMLEVQDMMCMMGASHTV
jgi:hypothetical protein